MNTAEFQEKVNELVAEWEASQAGTKEPRAWDFSPEARAQRSRWLNEYQAARERRLAREK